MGRRKKASENGEAATATEHKKSPRNPTLIYCIVELGPNGQPKVIRSTNSTVGQARKFLPRARELFSGIGGPLAIYKCVMVPDVRPENEPEEDAAAE